AATTSSTMSAGGIDCDKDKDGFKSFDCGGKDCNDFDKFTFPDAGFQPFPMADGGEPGYPPFDHNCDKMIEYQYPVYSCGATMCAMPEGYQNNNPDCGNMGALGNCTG